MLPNVNPSPTKPIVLFAEDNEDHAFFIERSLRSLGADLHHVADGEEALQRLEAWHDPLPCLVLLDVNMPRLSGLEVLERIRSHPKLELVPVVIFSTSSLPADRERAFAARANSYVTKPTDFSEFRKVLLELGQYWMHNNIRPAWRDAI